MADWWCTPPADDACAKGRELHALELTCTAFHGFLQSPLGSTAYKQALVSEFGSQAAAQELCVLGWKRAYV